MMNKAQELLDVLDSYYDNIPYAQIGYLQGVIRELAENCPNGDYLLESHTRHIRKCERELLTFREEALAA
jgi:hypothetical protein